LIKNLVKAKMESGQIAYGTFNAIKDPAIIEMMGHAGYDFTIIDMEHSMTTLGEVLAMARAADLSGITPIVRVPRGDTNTVMRVVEAGIPGVIAPHITSAADAQAIVDAAKYHPIGQRGMDPSTRSANYHIDSWAEHMTRSNQEVIVMIIIEDREGVENLDEICQVKGVDIGGIGPSDLSRSYGVPGQVDHPDVVAAVRRTTAKYHEYGIRVQRAGFDDATVAEAIASGATMITTPIVDSYFIADCFRTHLRRIKSVVEAG